MFVSLFDTRSERGRSHLGGWLVVSVLAHVGFLGWIAHANPEHAFRRNPKAIPVRLLRVPTIATVTPVEAPSPPRKDKRAPAEKPATRPTRQPVALAPKTATPPAIAERSEDKETPAHTTKDATTTPIARIYRQDEVDRAASPLEPIRPTYPRRERRRGREGSVLLRLQIAVSGQVEEIEVAESAGEAFDKAALAALREAHFRPATVDNAPVVSILHYRLLFSLR